MTKKTEKFLPSAFYKAADEWAGHPAPRFQEIKKTINVAINIESNGEIKKAIKQ